MDVIVKLFGGLWIFLMGACVIACIIVATSLANAPRKEGSGAGRQVGSVAAWLVGTVVGFLFWAFIIGMLVGFGFSHSGSLGVGGIIANVLLFGGPALYLYSSYRRVEAVKAAAQEIAADD